MGDGAVVSEPQLVLIAAGQADVRRAVEPARLCLQATALPSQRSRP